MRATLLSVLVGLAACTPEGGLIIEVQPADSSIDHIRVFIGAGDPTTPATFGPQGVDPLDGAIYWTRDHGNAADEHVVDGGKPVRFMFYKSDTDVVPAVIAVGYSNGAAVATAYELDVPITDDRVDIHILHLTAPVTTFDVPSANELALWSKPAITDPYLAQCAGVSTDRGPIFIVESGDQDCDGLRADDPSDFECNADEYMTSRAAEGDELTCLVDTQTSPAMCVLGGPSCTDGQPSDPAACDPSRYCTSTTMCACKTLDCLFAPQASFAPPIVCRVPATQGSGRLNLCSDPIVMPTLPNGGASCVAAAIRDATNGFDDRLSVENGRFDLDFDAGCNVSFTPSGDIAVTATLGPRRVPGLVTADLDNGAGVAVPIAFDVSPVNECPGAPVMCTGGFSDPSWLACGQPPAPACGGPGVIRDDFNDGVRNAQWNAQGSTTSQGGTLSLLAQDPEGTGYQAKHTVDLTGAAIEVEAIIPDNYPAAAIFQLTADPRGLTPTSALTMRFQNGALSISVVANGSTTTTLGIAYDATTMHHWRIAESGGMVTFATSADGTAWTPQYSIATPSFVKTVRIGLFARNGTSNTPAMEFDNLNTNVPVSKWCQASVFSDLFTRTTIGNDWLGRVPGNGGNTTTCQLGIGTGAVVMGYGVNQNCYFGTSPAYDLRGSSVTTRIAPSTNLDPAWTIVLEVASDIGPLATITLNAGQICGTAGNVCATYTGAENYWRMTEAAGTMHLQLSHDGVGWSTLSTLTSPDGLDAVEVRLGARTSATQLMSPAMVTFKTYN